MFNMICVCELQTKVILFDQVQRIENLLVQIVAHRFFLQKQIIFQLGK